MNSSIFNAARLYGNLDRAARPIENTSKTENVSASKNEEAGFTKALGDAAKQVSANVITAETKAAELITGNADPHSVVEALAAAELAVETAVTVRDRVVEAYQEILRMPI